MPRDDRGHTTDKFKKPNHPTFSDESQYSGQNGNVGGHWGDDGTFTPSNTNLTQHTSAELQQYFKQNEPDTKLVLPEKQAQWEAQRNDPNNKGVAQYMQGAWSQKKEDAVAKLGLNREQQVMQFDRENKPANEKKDLDLVAQKLAPAAEKGIVAFTRAYDALTPEQRKLAPIKPEDWTKDSARQIREIGMSAAEQERALKPSNAEAVASRFNQKELDEANTTHNALQDKEQEKWRLVGQYGEMLKPGPDGKPKSGAVDPLHPEKSVDMADPELRAFYQNQYNATRTEAEQLAKQQKDIRQRFGGGEFSRGPSAQPAGTPTSTTGTLWPGRSVTLKNGKTVKVTKVYPGGRFDYE